MPVLFRKAEEEITGSVCFTMQHSVNNISLSSYIKQAGDTYTAIYILMLSLVDIIQDTDFLSYYGELVKLLEHTLYM